MANMLPPVKNAAFTFYIALVSQADTDIFKTSPTLAAGDITISIDSGNFANITTLPTQIQTTGVLPVALTAAEMNGDVITVLFHDVAGSEWQDALVTVYTSAQTLDTIEGLVDDIGAAGAGLTALGDARLANLDAAISSRSSHSAADVWSAATRTLTSFGTLVADIWSYATRTLTSLSALVASIADAVWDELLAGHATAGSAGKALSDAGAAGDPWAAATRTLTQTAAQVAAILEGSGITVTRGDTTTISFTGLGNVTGYKEIWFTVKTSPDDADTAATIMVTESGGLTRLNGSGTVTAGNASITVNDEADGDIDVDLKPALTAALYNGAYHYDVQWKTASDEIHTLTAGSFGVNTDVTRATS